MAIIAGPIIGIGDSIRVIEQEQSKRYGQRHGQKHFYVFNKIQKAVPPFG
jgi:hypothetical protein